MITSRRFRRTRRALAATVLLTHAAAPTFAADPPQVALSGTGGVATFTPNAQVVALRVQVSDADGAVLFDSGWQNARSPIVWTAQGSDGLPLPAGVYPAHVEARDSKGKVRTENGSLTLEVASAAVQPASAATEGATIKPSAPGPLTGEGTLDRIARWTGDRTLGNSIMRQTGTLIVVEGSLSANTANNNGVALRGDAPNGTGVVGTSNRQAGVYGFTNATTGTAGVYGQATNNGTGVFGTAGTGVRGATVNEFGTAVVGESLRGTGVLGRITGTEAGFGIGVFGLSPTGTGVFGQTNRGGSGVQGVFAGSSSTVVPNAAGVLGSISGTGGNGAGVLGLHSGTGPGVRGTSENGTGVIGTSSRQAGVFGSTQATGATAGVYGTATGNGTGVIGIVRGTGEGVRGVNGGNGAGVLGESSGSTAGSIGVQGVARGLSGTGVSGSSPNGTGVFGFSTVGAGVSGLSVNGSGMVGETESLQPDAAAVRGRVGRGATGAGEVPTGLGPSAVRGDATVGSNTSSGVLGTSSGEGAGVRGAGSPSDGIGVVGTGEFGIIGESLSQGTGVTGRSAVSGVGVAGSSGDDLFAVGVSGVAYQGVLGSSLTTNGRGVVGTANRGSNAVGVLGRSTEGFAGLFEGRVGVNGNLNVSGTLTKGGGSFKIDHPQDPANKFLSHSFVESPDMMNIYNGIVRTDAKGLATVTMPSYFIALNRDFRYQLTSIGVFAQAIVARKIVGNRFVIRTNRPNVEVSWQVTGIRRDAWANAHRIPTSQLKGTNERGRYLYPAGFGKPAALGIGYKERLAKH